MPATCIILVGGYMYHGRDGHRGHMHHENLSGNGSFQYRIPPSWGPEREYGAVPYRFRAFCVDLRLWSILTDLDPRQQAAAVVLRLTGQAREAARTLTPEEMQHGGIVRGRFVDPISYIMTGLSSRYSQLGDESRLAAMMEFQAFQRYQGENIDALLDRFDLVRRREEPRDRRRLPPALAVAAAALAHLLEREVAAQPPAKVPGVRQGARRACGRRV